LDDVDGSHMRHAPVGVKALYAEKAASYFGNARHDIVAMLQTDGTSSILEVGCGAGGTGRAALAAGKAGVYVAIELDASAARTASAVLSEVIVGDVETLDLSRFEGRFDALILSEVLEHLTDPWETLRRLALCIRPGGAVFASSPNIGHWRAIASIVRGRFDYVESGVFDRTYRALFEHAGFAVEDLRALAPLTWKAKLITWISGGRLSRFFMVQMMVIGRRR
jgi:2-polyprenyl-3-methyl-5-hydroxy-6-metoxy-1,4-benzoquinol methylase